KKDAAAASFDPVNKLAIVAGDNELKIKSELSRALNKIFNVRWLVLHRIESCLQPGQRAVKRQIELTERGRLILTAGGPHSERAGNNWIAAAFVTSPLAKAHPETLAESLHTS